MCVRGYVCVCAGSSVKIDPHLACKETDHDHVSHLHCKFGDTSSLDIWEMKMVQDS